MKDWSGLLQRELILLAGIFRRPAATINSLRREAHPWLPLLVLLLTMFVSARLTQDIAVREYNDLLLRFPLLLGETDPTAATGTGEDSPFTQLLILSLVALMGRWLLALVLRLVARYFLRRDPPWRLLFSFSCYLGYIHAAGVWVRLPLQRALGSVRTTAGPSLLLTHPTGFLQHFIAQLDLFLLWEMGLAGLGLGLLLETEDHLRPAVIMVAFYLIWKMLGALAASAVLG